MARTKYRKKSKYGNVYFFYRLKHRALRNPRDVYGKTITELEEKIRKITHELDHGVISEKIIFTDYLEIWLHNVCFANKKESTQGVYANAYDNYIKNSDLSKIYLKDISALDIQEFYQNAIDNQGAGKGTIETLKKIIHPCIKYAYTQKKIITDFSRSIIVPERRQEVKERTRKPARALSVQEEKKLKEVIKGHKHECFIITALGTGMRHGELLALTWDDIDFETAVITVNKSYRPGIGVTSPKTESSNRQIPITQEVVKALKKHHAAQNETMLRLKNKYEQNNLVFANPTGKYINPSSMTLALKKIAQENDMEAFTPHDFRDTYATRLYEKTNNLKMIQQLLGHKNFEMTANKYTKVSLEKKSDFIQALENA